MAYGELTWMQGPAPLPPVRTRCHAWTQARHGYSEEVGVTSSQEVKVVDADMQQVA